MFKFIKKIFKKEPKIERENKFISEFILGSSAIDGALYRNVLKGPCESTINNDRIVLKGPCESTINNYKPLIFSEISVSNNDGSTDKNANNNND